MHFEVYYDTFHVIFNYYYVSLKVLNYLGIF
jgi:hypothetical protein